MDVMMKKEALRIADSATGVRVALCVGLAVLLGGCDNADKRAVNEIAMFVWQVQNYYRSSGNFAGISAESIAKMHPSFHDTTRIRSDGTKLVDAYGHQLAISSNKQSFALTIAGDEKPLGKKSCMLIAETLGPMAQVMTVGAAASGAGGKATGGHLFRGLSGPANVESLATGCSETAPVIAAQFH